MLLKGAVTEIFYSQFSSSALGVGKFKFQFLVHGKKEQKGKDVHDRASLTFNH